MLCSPYMSTDVLVKKLNREVGVLREEVNKMQKLLFQVVADTEGEYRPSYKKNAAPRKGEARVPLPQQKDLSRSCQRKMRSCMGGDF